MKLERTDLDGTEKRTFRVFVTSSEGIVEIIVPEDDCRTSVGELKLTLDLDDLNVLLAFAEIDSFEGASLSDSYLNEEVETYRSERTESEIAYARVEAGEAHAVVSWLDPRTLRRHYGNASFPEGVTPEPGIDLQMSGPVPQGARIDVLRMPNPSKSVDASRIQISTTDALREVISPPRSPPPEGRPLGPRDRNGG